MSPKVTDAYKQERRDAILETALDIFAEKGYSQGTLDEIVRRLGVSKGSVYLYFSGKDAIYTAIMEERTDRMVADFNGRFAAADGENEPAQALAAAEPAAAPITASGKLRLVFDTFREQNFAELHRLLAFHLDFWLESTRRDELKMVMDKQTATAVAFIRELVEEGIASGEFRLEADPAIAASLFWAARDGIALQFVSGGDPEAYRKLMAEMETMIFRYLEI